LFLAQVKFSSFVLKGCFGLILTLQVGLAQSQELTNSDSFLNTVIPAPRFIVSNDELSYFDGFQITRNFEKISSEDSILPNDIVGLNQTEIALLQSLLNPHKSDITTSKNLMNLEFVQRTELHLDENPEYSIVRKKGSLMVMATSYSGFFNAIQTLSQLMESNHNEKGYYLPSQLAIRDEPQFTWRGMHLDVSRHFFPVTFIKKYIDILSRYKINRFHWHLTDDQGWRIEIKKYPRLTQIGGIRAETMTAKNFNPYVGDGMEHSGVYTQEEIRDVIAYARLRNIEIIPEIEMPGHARAALAAYPELSCTGQKLSVPTTWGVFEDVYCNRESTFQFLFNVLDEVIALFPSKVIHIGGDEVPKTRWNACRECQKIRDDHQLKDAHELQSYFIQRIDSFVTSKGRTLIGWDEILEGGLAKNAMVMSWRGTEGGIAAANMGHYVVMTPGTHCYFDHYQDTSGLEPLAIGGYTSLEKVYAYKPIPEQLAEQRRHFILGAQANMWTEYMATESHVEYMLLPRICALSEVLWGTTKDFADFEERLKSHFEIFERNNWNYRK